MGIDKDVKTVQLSVSTWKALQQIKLDEAKQTLNDVIEDMIRDKGY